MAGSFFKTKSKNREYNYIPQYYKPEEGKTQLSEPAFARYRREWEKAGKESRKRSNYLISTRLIVIVCILVFIALYLLDFDLSIFTRGR